jgi:hypothetical protein
MKRSVKRNGVALLAVAPVALWLSSWEIEEARYSPFTLEYQKRHSRVILTGEIPLYQSAWTTEPNEVLNYIQATRFVEPVKDAAPRWEQVHRFKSHHGGGWSRPYAGLSAKMVAWSKSYPDVAPTFWRVAFRLLRSDKPNEVDAGYALVAELCPQCVTPAHLRGNLEFLDKLFKIDALSLAPELPAAALGLPTLKKGGAQDPNSRGRGAGGPPNGKGGAQPAPKRPAAPPPA